ncbi:MAG: DUF4136 domain-containing protein [Polaromonas sp.]
MKRALSAILSIALMTLFMAGCATVRGVQSDVTAFHHWNAAPPTLGTAYRFERLPSQQVVGAQQDYVEGLARTALSKVGMELNPAAARYSVQVMVNTQVVERPSSGGMGYDGFGFATPGVFIGGGSRGASLGMSFPIGFSEPYYRRELTLLVRDLRTNQVAFESHALSDGVQNETLAVLSAMLDSALNGFPQPPPGPRRINVQIPR